MGLAVVRDTVELDVPRLHSLSIAFYKAVAASERNENKNGLDIGDAEKAAFHSLAKQRVDMGQAILGIYEPHISFEATIDDAWSRMNTDNKAMTGYIAPIDIWAGVAIRAWGAEIASEFFYQGYQLLRELPLAPTNQDVEGFSEIQAFNLMKICAAVAGRPVKRNLFPENIAQLSDIANVFIKAANKETSKMRFSGFLGNKLVGAYHRYATTRKAFRDDNEIETMLKDTTLMVNTVPKQQAAWLATVNYGEIWAEALQLLRKNKAFAILPVNERIASGFEDLKTPILAKFCRPAAPLDLV